jgi:serine protease inhibitor
MKLTSIFGQKANLSLIFDPAIQVFVKDVIHKVTIEVNEKGSKASAVTGILLKLMACSFIILINNY